MNLEEENLELKRRLAAAQKWMNGEVNDAKKLITKEQTQGNTHNLYHENLEDIISERIYNFFPSEVLSHFPNGGVENIISSELIYYHIVHGGHVDGTGVILGYQKVIDSMVELYITKGFRKYAKKNTRTHSPENDPLEKAFHLVIEKKYILSLGRLYSVLNNIQSNKKLLYYSSNFLNYLKSRPFLEKSLLHSDFLLQLQSLIHLHALGEKRHHGVLSPSDTKKARNICIGNFTDTNSILYALAASQCVDL